MLCMRDFGSWHLSLPGHSCPLTVGGLLCLMGSGYSFPGVCPLEELQGKSEARCKASSLD